MSDSPGRAEGEESIAVNPTDPSNIIVGSNVFQPVNPQLGGVPEGLSGSQEAGVWASHDGGETWSGGPLLDGGVRTVPVPHPGQSVLGQELDQPGNFIGSDQNVVFDRRGNAYYESIAAGVQQAENGEFCCRVLVRRSGDGGRTWSTPVLAFSQSQTRIFIDRPFLAIDDSGGPRDGTLYLVWESQFYSPVPQSGVYVRTSTDQGRTWGAVHRVDDSAHAAMWDPRNYPLVGPDGTLDIVYDSSATATPYPDDPGSRNIQIYLARSTDGGLSFSHELVEPHAFRIPADPYEAIPAVEELITAVAVDQNHGGHYAEAWPDARSGEARILLRASSDYGTHWSSLVDAADDPPGAGNQHDHVALTYLPDGRVVIVWRDRRNGGGSFSGNFDIFARAFDVGGATPSPSGPVVRLTTSPQPVATFTASIQPSEYLAATAGPEGVTAAWDQMVGSLPDAVERRVPLAWFGAGSGLPQSQFAGASTAPLLLPNTGSAAPVPVTVLVCAAVVCGALRMRRRRVDPSRFDPR